MALRLSPVYPNAGSYTNPNGLHRGDCSGSKRRVAAIRCLNSRSQRHPRNVPGDFYVDHTCIDCDTCRWMAPLDEKLARLRLVISGASVDVIDIAQAMLDKENECFPPVWQTSYL